MKLILYVWLLIRRINELNKQFFFLFHQKHTDFQMTTIMFLMMIMMIIMIVIVIIIAMVFMTKIMKFILRLW